MCQVKQVSLLLIHFLQRSTDRTKRPVSFPNTGTRVLLEISTHFEIQLTPSHLNTHVVNLPLHRNRKSSPKFSSGKNNKIKKLLKTCNPPDSKPYLANSNVGVILILRMLSLL